MTDFVHKIVTRTALPYNTFNSPTSTDPIIQLGENVMTSVRGYAEMYPGFSQRLCTNQFQKCKRIFIWKKWDGNYIAMYCDSDFTSKVYKQELGVDKTAILIFTSASSEPFDFTDANNWCYFGNGTDMKKYNGSAVYKWGLSAPKAQPELTSSSGLLKAYAGGWYYRTTGVRSIDSHESSPMPLADGELVCTGLVSDKKITLTWNPADYDAEADKIRIYRTTDGGSTNPVQMALVAEVDKSLGTYTDEKLDANLSATTFCPPVYRNDPPPPAFGFAKYAGRIYMQKDDKQYFTGREEISNGVPQDCVPGGTDGNYQPFDGKVTAVAERSTGVATFLGRKIMGLDGATLDTMYPYLLLDRRGAINRTNVISLGSSVVWFDTAKQVWLDGEEIGRDIRPDLAQLDPNNVSLAVHLSGQLHWLCLCDAASGRLWTYDLDTQQWMPPRDCGATLVYSNNTSDSTVDLLIVRNGYILKLVPGTYNDDGDAYNSWAVSNLWDMTPEANPDFNGHTRYVGIESNSVRPASCKVLVDDDPQAATFLATAVNNEEEKFLRRTGEYIKETRFMTPFDETNPSGRRVAFRLDWDKPGWKWFSLDVAIQPAQTQPQ